MTVQSSPVLTGAQIAAARTALDALDYATAPDLWRGLEPDGPNADEDLSTFFRRGFARVRLEADGPVVLPGYSQDDWSAWAESDPLVANKSKDILDVAQREHDARHWYYAHPFCRRCRLSILADGALASWLADHPGTSPRDIWDGRTSPATDRPPRRKRTPPPC